MTPRALKWTGALVALLGALPFTGPALTALAHTLLPRCVANEAGANDCILAGRDIGPALSAVYSLAPAIPLGFLALLIGGLLWLAGWGISRTTARRAKHR